MVGVGVDGGVTPDLCKPCGPLAPFIADPKAAKRTGALPLKPPTRSGRAFEGAGP